VIGFGVEKRRVEHVQLVIHLLCPGVSGEKETAEQPAPVAEMRELEMFAEPSSVPAPIVVRRYDNEVTHYTHVGQASQPETRNPNSLTKGRSFGLWRRTSRYVCRHA
jgi:hypothetical protein